MAKSTAEEVGDEVRNSANDNVEGSKLQVAKETPRNHDHVSEEHGGECLEDEDIDYGEMRNHPVSHPLNNTRPTSEPQMNPNYYSSIYCFHIINLNGTRQNSTTSTNTIQPNIDIETDL